MIEVIHAEVGYRGSKMAASVAKTGVWRLELVKRNDVLRFEVLPKRRIVERHIRSVVAFIRLAKIRIMLRCLAATQSE